jgi:uncharacterized iron-regulated membrane protein
MSLTERTPIHEDVWVQVLIAVKKAREEQAILSVDSEIARIRQMYPDAHVSSDQMTVAIATICGWERVSMRLA